MTNWRAVTLADVCDFENGDRGKNYPGKSANLDEGVPFVNAGDLDDGSLRSDTLSYISADNFRKLSNGKFKKGDILFCLRGTLGKFALIESDISGAIASSLIIIRPKNSICRSYLKSYLGSQICDQQIDLYRNGAAQPNLAAGSLKKFEIPLPPLDEQRRIAAILDKADALRRKRKRTLDLTNGLTQSIFLEMFGDPFAKKSSLRRVDFEEVTTRITYGFTQPMSHHDKGIPILTAKNIRFGYIDFENVAYADRAEFDGLTAKSKPSKFDILITKDGAIGRSACVLTDDHICINQSVALVKPRRDLVEPLYLLHYLLSAPVQARIESMKKGNAMPHLQITELAKFPVALPSLDLQRNFVSQLSMNLEQEARLKQSLQESDSLFSSLQHRAFFGQL